MHIATVSHKKIDKKSPALVLEQEALTHWFHQVKKEYLAQLEDSSEGRHWWESSVQLDLVREFRADQDLHFEMAVDEIRRDSFSIGCRIYQDAELRAVGRSEIKSKVSSIGVQSPFTPKTHKNLESALLSFHRIANQSST